MAKFEIAIPKLLLKEGGSKITQHPDDAGGLTKYGISQRAYPKVNIRTLTEEQAKAIYRADYWQPLKLDEEQDQDYAEAVFEFAVHAGVETASALEKACPDQVSPSQAKLAFFKLGQIARYATIVAKKPSQKVFLLGWINRVLGGSV